jgi:hypothetical protein
MVLVDVWRIRIPYDEAELHTASKILGWGSFWVGMLEVEGDEIDVIAVGEEKYAPTDVSNHYPTIFSSIIRAFIPRMTSSFKDRTMIPPRMLSPVLYKPVVHLGFEDGRLFWKGRKDQLIHALICQAS